MSIYKENRPRGRIFVTWRAFVLKQLLERSRGLSDAVSAQEFNRVVPNGGDFGAADLCGHDGPGRDRE